MKVIPIRRMIKEVTILFPMTELSGGIIAGGAARFMASPQSHPIPNGDIDVFFKGDNIEDINRRIEQLKSCLVAIGAHSVKETSFAFTLSFMQSRVQLIKPMASGGKISYALDPDKIIGAFDFTVNAVYLKSLTEAVCHDNFEEDEGKRRIRFLHIANPMRNIYRISKMMNKGYTIPKEEVLVMFTWWEGLQSFEKAKIMADDGVEDFQGGYGEYGRAR